MSITLLVAIPAIVLMLILVVGLHELGHAIAAKLCGVKITRIAIGFGKPILCWQSQQDSIEWVWAIWPLGGYVTLLNTRIAPVEPANYSKCFDKQPTWIRIIILISGTLANLFVGWFCLTIYFMLGYQQDTPVVQNVIPNSIVAIAGIKPHDQLLNIAGQQTNSWQEVAMRFIVNLGQKQVSVTVQNPQKTTHVVFLNLESIPLTRHSLFLQNLGIQFDLSHHQSHDIIEGKPLTKAIQCAIDNAIQLLIFFLLMVKQLVTGKIAFAMLLGPVGLLAVSANTLAQGVSVFLHFIANLSLAVGLINLFPIPSLDGGSIIYALIEKIRGQPVSIALEILLHRLATIAFFILLVQLIMNDVQRYLH